MNGVRGDVDKAARDYVAQPAAFGADTTDVKMGEEDAFRAGVAWAIENADWRVLAGLIPGVMRAAYLRPGDVVADLGGVTGEVVYVSVGARSMHFTVRTEGGAEIVFERFLLDTVTVRQAVAS